MIAIDTSALAAIAFEEPEWKAFKRIVVQADIVLISSVTVVEARVVIFARKGAAGLVVLEALLGSQKFEVVAPGDAELDIALEAFVSYGKGRGHPAQLNFGDLFSYALAKARGVPLLYKGADFAQTDVLGAA